MPEQIKTFAVRLRERAKREPLDVDISDYSDEWCAGFLAGQVNAIDCVAELLEAAQNLYERSVKCWEDDADETPGHVRDPWLWGAWVDDMETTAAALARLDAARPCLSKKGATQ